MAGNEDRWNWVELDDDLGYATGDGIYFVRRQTSGTWLGWMDSGFGPVVIGKGFPSAVAAQLACRAESET